MALRIYGNKWHVYAGLAILNPSAKRQIEQYAKSVSDLFMLMIQEKREEFTNRIRKVIVFHHLSSRQRHLSLEITRKGNLSFFRIQF